MRTRGLGRVFQPVYRDKKSREQKRARVWWVQYSFRGRVYRESSGSTIRGIAVNLLKRRLAEIGKGRLIGPDAEKTTFEDLAQMVLDDYRVNSRRSIAAATGAVRRLRYTFGLSRAMDITSDRVTAYARTRQEAGAKPATIRYELAILKRGFNLALQAGKLVHRPHIPSIEVRNVRSGFFQEPEFRAVLSHLPEDVKGIVEFAYLTGWRMGEILPLQWRQVDFKARTVRLEPGTTKNDEGRTFPFATFPALATLLERQRERTVAIEKATERIITWVFHRDGKPIRDFRGAWHKACKAAGLAGAWLHDFRRTAVRNLERAGVPRSVAMKLTGHKTESIYRRYAIVSEADLSEGVAKLAVLHHAEQGSTRTVLPLQERTGKVLAKS